MICKNPNCNFSWHCFVRGKENKDFVPPCVSLKEWDKKNKTKTESEVSVMTIEEAIKHVEAVAKEQDKLRKRYDDASGYTRSHNKDIRTNEAKRCEKCAEEHRQIAEWLKELKQLREQTKWVPVSERLPDNDGDYRVIEKSGRVGTYVFHKEGNSEEYWKRCAVAWMSHKTESELKE